MVGYPSAKVHDPKLNHSEGGVCNSMLHYKALLLCVKLQSSLREWVGAETSSLGAYDVKYLTFPLLIFPLPC